MKISKIVSVLVKHCPKLFFKKKVYFSFFGLNITLLQIIFRNYFKNKIRNKINFIADFKNRIPLSN
jgi:ADP-dependent phosphofructokinase/glucokinase